MGDREQLRHLRLSAYPCAPRCRTTSAAPGFSVSAITQNKNTMTDTNPSGASFAPAADSSATAASAETPAGNFGSTRGSGLARGKRQSGAAAPTAQQAVSSDYKPTSLEVITPASEYRNPFAAQEPASPPAEEPAKVETPVAPVAVQAEPEHLPEPSVPMFASEPEAAKPEIRILPPDESVRPAVSWESPSATAARESDRHGHSSPDERPTFRPDRREDMNGGAEPQAREPRTDGREPRRDSFNRQPRDPREARQPRDPRDARQPRDPREARQPRDPRDERPQLDQRPRRDHNRPAEHVPATAPSSGGFLGWLKGLFGAKKPEAAPAGRESAGEPFGDGQRHRRRHRGGRGHGGNPQGFRGERSSQGAPRPEGEQRGEGDGRGGERHGGSRRRRHRGGQGRDRGGEPRSEGRQGGGAI